MRKTGIAALVILLTLILGIGAAQAQDNLLRNGGLEEGSFGQYTGRRGGDKPIYLPEGWNYWFAGQTGEFNNRGDKATIQPHPGPGPSPQEGTRAMNINCDFVSCTASVFQTVNNLVAGSNYSASAWSQVKACNRGGAESCGSARESGSQTRIGLDPTGGSDPNNPAIVWSAYVQPHDQWLQQSVSATATGTVLTVFLYSTQSAFADLNRTYWDDVRLTGGGSGGAAAPVGTVVVPTPIPTAPPVAAFVVPQAAQPDGSIVHTVQSGDTLASIAFAYGTTRQDLLALNNLQSANFIFPGQKLLIKPAPTATPVTPTVPPTATPTTAPTNTPAAVAATNTRPPATAAPTNTRVRPTSALPTVAPTTSSGQAVAPTNAPAVAQASTDIPTDVPPPTDALPTDVPPTGVPTEVPATPTETLVPPTAPVQVADAGGVDPAARTASVCVILFDDANQNRLQEQGEALLKDGTIRLLQGSEEAGAYQTDGTSEPHCFSGLASGDYVAAASAPGGYGLTTPDQLRVRLNPGSQINLTFGAASGVQPAQPPPASSGPLVSENAPQVAAQPPSVLDQIMAVSGFIVLGLAGLVLIGGIGLALLLRRR